MTTKNACEKESELIKLIQILIANCMIHNSKIDYEKEIEESWQNIFKHVEKQKASSYVEGYNKAVNHPIAKARGL